MRYKKVKISYEINWYVALVAMGFFGFLINVMIFYPGYMSNDSLNQLRQAKGLLEMTDLTPPVMTLMWRFLINITGHVSSMLFFHLTMLWAALVGLSIYIYRLTNKRTYSLAALAIGGLPFIANISGVIWKDNSMTFALILSVVIILFLDLVKKKSHKITLFTICLVFLLYAALVRYNALLCILPIVFLLISRSGLIRELKWQIGSTIIFCMVTVGSLSLINKLADVQSSNPVSAVMIDDVLNISNSQAQSEALRASIDSMKVCKEDKKMLINNFWVCANDKDRANIQYVKYNELTSLWFKSVLDNPLSYVSFRAVTFTMFLLPLKDGNFYWQNGIISNELGQNIRFDRLGDIHSMYIKNFGFAHFPYLFEPWFWLVVSVVIVLYAFRLKKAYFRTHLIVLSGSSLIYMIGYYPTGATNDYRYIYWPVFASLICVILIFLMRSSRKLRFRRLA